MWVYDERVRDWVWEETPAEVEVGEGLLSPGQAIAALLMLPLVVVWVLDQYGIDALAWIDVIAAGGR